MMSEMKSKRAWVIFVILFTCLNCILFVYFSTNIPRNFKIRDTNDGALLSRKNKQLFKYYVENRRQHFHQLLDDDEIPTDVDRSEDRMKKKRFLKMKRSFEDKCLQDENLCTDLREFLKDGTQMLTERKYTKNNYRIKSSGAVKNKKLKRLPEALIIGAKKAGTRALLSFLCLHPLVKAAGPEVHFFDRFFYRGVSWYRNQLPKCNKSDLLIEKTPAYFVDKDVPKRVANTLPNIKLLLVVRDPVTRAISDYTQGLSNHGLRHSFEEIAFKNASTGLVNVAWGPVRGGLYSKHFQRWRKYFARDKIHVISGEHLVQNPAEELRTVQEFLGLQVLIDENNFHFNATKGFPCIVNVETKASTQDDTQVGNRTKETTRCLGYSKGRSHPNVSRDAVLMLRDFYRPFNQKFYKLVGKDFGWP